MYHFINFLFEHWFLSLNFLIVFFLLIFIEFFDFNSSFSLYYCELVNLMNHKSIIIVDFRDKNSYLAYHILGSFNVDLNEIYLFLKKYSKKVIILVCKNGRISSKKASVLFKNGYTDIKFLKGGIDFWMKDGYPVN